MFRVLAFVVVSLPMVCVCFHLLSFVLGVARTQTLGAGFEDYC